MMKQIVAVLLVIVGIVSLIMAGSVGDPYTGAYESTQAYGGDAYTGIQNAAAQTANNVRWTTEAVGAVGSAILTVAGLALMVAGVAAWPVTEDGKPAMPFFMNKSAAPVAEAPAVETVLCPNCGSSQEATAEFCGSCGNKMN